MRQQTLVIRHQNEKNIFSFCLRAFSPVRSQRCAFLSYRSTTVQGTSLVGWLTINTAVLPRSHIALVQAHSQLTVQLATYSKNTQQVVQFLVQANAQVLLQSGYPLREFLSKRKRERAFSHSSRVSALKQRRAKMRVLLLVPLYITRVLYQYYKAQNTTNKIKKKSS